MKIRERVNLAAGILFTLIIGTLLHFTYEWSRGKPILWLSTHQSMSPSGNT